MSDISLSKPIVQSILRNMIDVVSENRTRQAQPLYALIGEICGCATEEEARAVCAYYEFDPDAQVYETVRGVGAIWSWNAILSEQHDQEVPSKKFLDWGDLWKK